MTRVRKKSFNEMRIRLYLDGIAAALVSLSFASRSARAWSETAPSPPPEVLLLLVDMSVSVDE